MTMGFPGSLGVSLALHAAVMGAGWGGHRETMAAPCVLTIDLARPASGAPAKAPSAPAARAAEKSWAPEAVAEAPEAPAPETSAPAGLAAPSTEDVEGIPGDNMGGGTLTRLPRLLNGHELKGHMKRFYPPEEQGKGLGGRVVVEFCVREDGRVCHGRVMEATAESFGAAALRVAELLRFSPGRSGGKAVMVKVRQSFVFRMEAKG